jgi:ABC-type transport system involved in multi-copper enzyme maturation permease subunit
MPTQILTIARNTFTEAIRQPIFVVLLLVAGTVLGFTPTVAAYTLEHGRGDNKMLIDLGLSTVFLAGVLLAAFTATGVLTKEIENRTVLTVVSKPVSRPLFVLGKFLGVFAAIAVAHLILCIVLVLTIRHGVMQTASDKFDHPVLAFGAAAVLGSIGLAAWGNYYLSWSFTSTLVRTLAVAGVVALALVLVIDPHWDFQSPVAEFTKHEGELAQISIGLLLILEAVMILTAVAIACSTRLGQVMTLVVCFGVYLLGIISNSASGLADQKIGLKAQAGYFESFGQILASQAEPHMKVVAFLLKILYGIAPNLQFLWPADAITQGHPFDGMYILSVSLYATLYTLVVLAIAVALFQSREVG